MVARKVYAKEGPVSYRIKGAGNRVDVEIRGINGRKTELMEAFKACEGGCCDCPAAGAGNLTSFEVVEEEDGLTLHLRAREGTHIDEMTIANCVEFTMGKPII